MIIESLHISGFGTFQDTGLSSLPSGMTVIYAPNGSGKTTLRDFLRAALFGFQKNDNRYDPVGTTAHGGLLQVRDKNQQAFTIHFDVSRGRAQSRVKLPDGQDGPPLETLLSAASPEIFRNIFTLGLPELQDAEGFNTSKEIQVMIGAFGGGHSGHSFLKWRKALEEEQMALFRPGGQKPEINSKLAEIDKLQNQLKALQAEAEKYWSYDAEFLALEEETASIAEHKKNYSRQLHHLENLQKAWPEWIQLGAVREQLSALSPQVEEFPAQGLEKYEKLNERRQQQTLKVKQHREEQELLQQKLQTLQVSSELLECSVALDEAWDRLALYQSNGTRLRELNHKKSIQENELQSKLAELGAGWTLDRALAFKDDVATRTERQEAVRELADSKQEVKRYATELERAGQVAKKLESECLPKKAAFERDWATPPVTEELLDERQGGLTKLRTLILEESRLQEDLKRCIRETEECIEALKNLQEQISTGQTPKQSSTLFIFLGAAVLLGALIAAALLRENLPAMGATLVFGVIGAALCWLLGKQAANSPAAAASYFNQQTERQQKKKTELEAEHARLQTGLEKLQGTITAAGQQLGFPANDTAKLDAFEAELKKQREARRQFDRAQNDVAEAEQQATRAKELAAKLQEESVASNKQLEAALARWQTWLQAQGLSESLSVEAADATSEHLKKVQDIYKLGLEESRTADDLKTQVEAYEGKCREIFSVLNKAWHEQIDWERELRELRVLRDATVENQRQYQQLEESWKAGELAAPGLLEDARKLVQEFSELLAQGAALDENQFVERALAWQKRQELQAAERSLLERLQMLSAPGAALVQLQTELAALDHETLVAHLDETARQNALANAEFDRLNQRQGELLEARRRLASDEEVGLCVQKLEQAKTELQELATQWAVSRLAFRLMEKARHKFETERQPAVLQSAGESLNLMSRGRYEGIMRPLGSSESHLVQPNGELRGNERIWNTALKEKVYLSLRFGLIETYNERLEPLPVILDDALVNLDPHNMRGSAQAILRLAERQQVIYLTCHPHTVEHFAAHDEALRVYRISEQGKFELNLP